MSSIVVQYLTKFKVTLSGSTILFFFLVMTFPPFENKKIRSNGSMANLLLNAQNAYNKWWKTHNHHVCFYVENIELFRSFHFIDGVLLLQFYYFYKLSDRFSKLTPEKWKLFALLSIVCSKVLGIFFIVRVNSSFSIKCWWSISTYQKPFLQFRTFSKGHLYKI